MRPFYHHYCAVNTKAEIRFNVREADWIPLRVKERLKLLVRTLKIRSVPTIVFMVPSQYRTKINQSGEIIITSQVHRTQHQNLQDAINKLGRYLEEASEVPEAPSEAKLKRIKKLYVNYTIICCIIRPCI